MTSIHRYVVLILLDLTFLKSSSVLPRKSMNSGNKSLIDPSGPLVRTRFSK